DFAPRPFPSISEMKAVAAPLPSPPPARADDSDLQDRLGEKQDLAGSPDGAALYQFQKVADRARGELGPATAGQATDSLSKSDADWASLEALRRLFETAGAPADKPAPAGPPLPPEQAGAIESRVARIEALKAALQADLAQRDAAETMLAVANHARDAALEERRSGKDDLEFRKNFARLAMVMDLSYSLNLLNNADAALAKMQALVAQKAASIAAQQQANNAAGAAAGAQAGNTDQWTKDAQASAAADQAQAGSFSSLGQDVSGVSKSVARFASDVPALLAMIDARDKGQSANAVAE